MKVHVDMRLCQSHASWPGRTPLAAGGVVRDLVGVIAFSNAKKLLVYAGRSL